jgi:hypothetical protein
MFGACRPSRITWAGSISLKQWRAEITARAMGVSRLPTVVYVMGTARSGSTLLGVMLDNCEGVFFGGELRFWELLSGSPWYDNPDALEFWRRVKETMPDYADLYGDTGSRYPDYPTLSFEPSDHQNVRRLRARYRAFNRDFFEAISRASGCDYIVDTSHYPWRVKEMRKVEGLRVVLVYIMRNPHGVVNSLGRELRKGDTDAGKGLVSANAYLWATYVLGWLVFLTHPRRDRVFLQYEDLMAMQRDSINRILDRLDPSVKPPKDLVNLKRGPQFSGNNILFDSVIVVDPKRDERVSRSIVTSVLQAPWMLSAAVAKRFATFVPSRRI